MANSKMTQEAKLLRALQNGSEFTANQIVSRFGIKNPYAVVQNLKLKGYAIYLNNRTNSVGQTYKKYRIGTPTRAVVAAGYRALMGA
jgi:predicted ArsR family transcriptional regulator|tara:strand:+ start:4411 stop:4671 length:261 start_codon:yes stop_codon:yes gene_type:complete